MHIHSAMKIVGDKIVQQGEFYNVTELTIDMMALSQTKEAAEENQQLTVYRQR